MTDIILNQHVPGGVMKQLGDAAGGVTYDQYAPGGCMGQLYQASGLDDPLDQYAPGGAIGQIEDEIEGGGGPEWVPAGAVTFLDFKNGQYWWGSAEHTQEESVEENSDWGPFDASKIVDGTGVRCTGTALQRTLFVLTEGAAAGLLPSDGGFTCVLRYSNTMTGSSGQAQTNIEVLDLPGYNVEWTAAFVQSQAGQSNIVGSDSSVSPVGDAGDVHIAALTFTPASIACSVDGNAVLEDTTITDNSAATHIAVQVRVGGSSFTGTAILESMAFYAPVDNGDLPGMSEPGEV